MEKNSFPTVWLYGKVAQKCLFEWKRFGKVAFPFPPKMSGKGKFHGKIFPCSQTYPKSTKLGIVYLCHMLVMCYCGMLCAVTKPWLKYTSRFLELTMKMNSKVTFIRDICF